MTRKLDSCTHTQHVMVRDESVGSSGVTSRGGDTIFASACMHCGLRAYKVIYRDRDAGFRERVRFEAGFSRHPVTPTQARAWGLS